MTKQALVLSSIASTLFGVLAGAIILRYGQHVIIENFNACMEDGIRSVQTLDEVLTLQYKCRPNEVLRNIFFW